MAERIPADMDAFLREHAARATPLPEVREAALARWPHAPDATDEQRRAHETRIETAYKHRRKRAREEARAALAEASVPQEVLAEAARPCYTVRIDDVVLADAMNLATDQRVSASVDGPENQIAPSSQTTKIDVPHPSSVARGANATLAAPFSCENLQGMIDVLKDAPRVITVRSDVERLEGVADNLAAQVGRLADAVSQMLAQAADVGAAKDALIETQKRYIEHLQRMVGA